MRPRSLLWHALYLPQLPLEVHGRGPTADHQAVAVIERGRIVAVSDTASYTGIHPGMSLAAAHALLPGLQPLPRRPQWEGQTLRRLADWALQFTSQVSRDAPDTLLLELGGSLRLFGGLEPLCGAIHRELTTLGHRWRSATAPTPTAAWLLARHGDPTPVWTAAELPQRLAPLPCTLLPLPAEQREALQGLGVHTLGELTALPRADLGKRLGQTPLLLLERALGRAPDPRPPHRPRRRYQGWVTLPAPTAESEALLFALSRLLRELAGLLRGLAAGVQQLDLELEHRRPPATRLTVGLMRPSRDLQHLLLICRERLQRRSLRSAVTALCLRAEQLLPLAPQTPGLLQDEPCPGEPDRLALAERLGTRLGEDRVCALATRPEHRPERAWQPIPPGQSAAVQPHPHRPLWLLRQPRPLATEQGRPVWQGTPLRLCQAAERIESGWWDGEDIARDYYRAQSADGAVLWVYRDRRAPYGWFLHGFFG